MNGQRSSISKEKKRTVRKRSSRSTKFRKSNIKIKHLKKHFINQANYMKTEENPAFIEKRLDKEDLQELNQPITEQEIIKAPFQVQKKNEKKAQAKTDFLRDFMRNLVLN